MTKKKTGVKDLLMRLGPALALILMFVVFAIVMPNKFLRVGNLMNVLKLRWRFPRWRAL